MTDYYYCCACRNTVKRDSRKLWIRSWCGTTARMTRLWRKP